MADVRNLLRPVALTSLIANVVIVITGGAVRLTGSGLGCPTWPTCTDESLVPVGARGVHEAIEFGNRMLGVIVGMIAVAALIVAWRTAQRSLAIGVLAGVLAQGLVGGITVLTGLNPWTVGLHFLVSMGILAAAYVFWKSTAETEVTTVPGPLRTLVWILAAVSLATIAVGTVVTGSGPHAGDAETPRNGLDPESLTQAHTDLVFLLLGLAIAAYFAVKAVGASPQKLATLLLVLGLQGIVGFVQYFNGLPELLVGLHMLGACLVWLATLAVVYSVRGGSAPRATTPERVGATTSA